MLRHGVRALLERHGVEVVAEASDGRMAAAAAREHHPDVAVLDIMMPLLNGIDAAREIAATCPDTRSEEHTSELQSQSNLVCRLLLEKKKQRHHICNGLDKADSPQHR